MTVHARLWGLLDRPDFTERERAIFVARSCGVRLRLLAVAFALTDSAILQVAQRVARRLERINRYLGLDLAPVLPKRLRR